MEDGNNIEVKNKVVKNGKKVDPLKIKAATGANLAGADLRKFKQEVSRIVAMVEKDSKLASK